MDLRKLVFAMDFDLCTDCTEDLPDIMAIAAFAQSHSESGVCCSISH